MLLHFQDPLKLKTKKVVYEATYYARDCRTLEHLKNLTTHRKAFEESLNGSSNLTAAIAREMSGGATSRVLQDLQKLETYLPLLENLVRNIMPQRDNPQILLWTSELKLRWTSPLSACNGFNLTGPKYYGCEDLRFELVMSLSLYAALLRQRGLEVACEGDFAQASMLFRKAAGVYSHIAEELLPKLQPYLSRDKRAELTSSVAMVMRVVSLAEAQAIIIRKAETNSTSGLLLSKLHYGVVEFLEEATAHMKAAAVSDKLKRFVTACSVLHEARSRRLFAEEYKKQEKLGTAAAVLRIAHKKAQRMKVPADARSKKVCKDEMCAVSEMLRKCEHENEFIWREPAPPADKLPSLEGKKIVTAVPYVPSPASGELVFVM